MGGVFNGGVARAILRVVVPYVVFAGLWILVSDRALQSLVSDPATITQWSIYKGLAFVLVTALLLAILLHVEVGARARNEAALRQSEERLEFAMEGANDGIWDVDLRTGSTFLSPRGCEMFGYRPDELQADVASWNLMVHPDDLPATLAALDAHLHGRSPSFEVEQRLRTKRGDFRWILARGKVSARDEAGQPTRMTGTHSDITERKQAEEEIRRLNDELEQRVRERTAQLETANKELEAFSYSVSHDLRAPLRAVDGYCRILLEDHEPHLDAEGKRVCAVISESARDMGRLIDDLLAFSRIGRVTIGCSPVDMATLARSVFLELTTSESRERIDFQVAPLPPAMVDPSLIRQVWMNLLSNAVKFSARVELAVIEVSSEQRGDEAVYSVRDNGAGFDMRYVGKLFGVFQRLHTTREFEGTGVGLAIVQRIIHRHGGRVWAEGVTGKGATFYFSVGKGA